MGQNVAIIGASPKPDRYSFKAMKMLEQHGHTVFLVSPVYTEIEGLKVESDLANLSSPIHTVTMYVSADKSSKMEKQIIALKPKRIIFNPGAENPSMAKKLSAQGIECLDACTLVMLTVGSF